MSCSNLLVTKKSKLKGYTSVPIDVDVVYQVSSGT